MGVPEDEIDAYLNGNDDGEEDAETGAGYEVFPDNWETVQVFLVLASQWRRDPMTGRLEGLNYPSVESAMRMMKIESTAEVFHGVRVMEFAAMRVLNKAG